MKHFIDSPYARAKAELNFEIKNETFRKEKFRIFHFYYKCLKTKKEFTTTETGDLNITQLFNQYRERKKILFPEQIIKLRLGYNLSASKMSEILGFGANTYSSYERGEIPNDSNATLLNLAYDPANFRKIILEKRKLLTDRKFTELLQIIDVRTKGNQSSLKEMFFPEKKRPDEYSGYRIPDFEKFANIVLFFLKDIYTFTTRLNKYLFYTDFLNFSKTDYSVTGLAYSAIPNGPVPDKYGFIYDILAEEGYIKYENAFVKENEYSKYVPLKKFNKELFTETELNSMTEVYSAFRYKKTPEIINISHKEEGWKNNHKKSDRISYKDYAFVLKGIES